MFEELRRLAHFAIGLLFNPLDAYGYHWRDDKIVDTGDRFSPMDIIIKDSAEEIRDGKLSRRRSNGVVTGVHTHTGPVLIVNAIGKVKSH